MTPLRTQIDSSNFKSPYDSEPGIAESLTHLWAIMILHLMTHVRLRTNENNPKPVICVASMTIFFHNPNADRPRDPQIRKTNTVSFSLNLQK